MSAHTRTAILASTFAAVMFLVAPLDAQRGQSGKGGRTAPQGGQERSVQAERRSAPAPQARAQAERPEQKAAPSRAPQVDRSIRQVQREAPQREAQPVQRQAPQLQREAPQGQRSIGQIQREVPQGQRSIGQVQREAPQVQRNAQPTFRGGAASRVPQAIPRTQQRYSQPRNAPYGSYGSYGRTSYQVRRPVFVQPYFSFRPRLTLSFGLRLGYAVSYPFQYYDPYGFYNFRIGPLPSYGISNYGSYYQTRVGGLSFDIDPYDADVFIDGEYVGVAADFSFGQMPLTLAAGRHHVDLQADGYLPVSFDITVVAGQVIPYEGTLPYAYTR